MVRGSLVLAAWRMDRKLPMSVMFLLLLNVGAWIGMTYHVSPRLEHLEKEFIARQTLLRQSRAELRAPQEPQEDLWAARDDLQTFLQAIPSRTEFTVLIGELFALAGEAGLEINQISYAPEPIPERNLLQYGLNFSVAGDYSQIKRFVHSLEQAERLIAIQDISLAGNDQQGGEQVRLNLRLFTLFRTAGL
jgi:type IV pilus assembly protein PilO